MTNWLTDWSDRWTVRLTDQLNDRVNKEMAEWVNKGLGKWMDSWLVKGTGMKYDGIIVPMLIVSQSKSKLPSLTAHSQNQSYHLSQLTVKIKATMSHSVQHILLTSVNNKGLFTTLYAHKRLEAQHKQTNHCLHKLNCGARRLQRRRTRLRVEAVTLQTADGLYV